MLSCWLVSMSTDSGLSKSFVFLLPKTVGCEYKYLNSENVYVIWNESIHQLFYKLLLSCENIAVKGESEIIHFTQKLIKI